MSRAATSTARKALQQHVKPSPPTPAKTPPPQKAFEPKQFLSFKYEPFPAPINCTTLNPTKDFATDEAHPFHTRIKRKLEAFDPGKLHWRVQCPVDVSNKGFIRTWAGKRVRNAFLQRLKDEGWERDGTVAQGQGQGDGSPGTQKERLGGALLMILQKGDIALTASKKEVQMSVRWVLHSMLRQRAEALGQRKWTDRSTYHQGHERAATPSAEPPSKSTRKDYVLTTTKPQFNAPDFEAIRQQIEYYFSDTNLASDSFLLSLTSGSANRPVALRKLCSFKKLQGLNASASAVKDALCASRSVEVVNMPGGEDGVRRKVPLGVPLLQGLETHHQTVSAVPGARDTARGEAGSNRPLRRLPRGREEAGGRHDQHATLLGRRRLNRSDRVDTVHH